MKMILLFVFLFVFILLIFMLFGCCNGNGDIYDDIILYVADRTGVSVRVGFVLYFFLFPTALSTVKPTVFVGILDLILFSLFIYIYLRGLKKYMACGQMDNKEKDVGKTLKHRHSHGEKGVINHENTETILAIPMNELVSKWEKASGSHPDPISAEHFIRSYLDCDHKG